MYSIEELSKLIEMRIAEIDFPQTPSGLYDPARYVLSGTGKRIRPALALSAANLFSDEIDACVDVALAMEVFHNFTLVHDDIMDNAPMRRGLPSVHEKWDLATAILSGDVLLIRAYELLCSVNAEHLPPVISIFNDTARKVCEGQQMDMDFESADHVTLEEYITMIRNKTAVLLGCSLYCGAMAGNGGKENAELLYDAGLYMGIGFQIQDDMLDAYGDPKKFGKKSGGDIIRNKKTYLSLRTLEKLFDEEKENYAALIRSANFSDEDKITAVLKYYDQCNVKDDAVMETEKYFSGALRIIDQLHVEEKRKNILRELAESVMKRGK